MTVISIGKPPSINTLGSERPKSSGGRLVNELDEIIHRSCGMTIRPQPGQDTCPYCNEDIKPVAPVSRTALGSAPTPTPATKEGTNYLKNNRNRPIPTTNKSVTDIH